MLVHNHEDQDEGTLPADWVLVTTSEAVLDNPAIRIHSKPITARAGARIWTDDYNDLLRTFKAPELRR